MPSPRGKHGCVITERQVTWEECRFFWSMNIRRACRTCDWDASREKGAAIAAGHRGEYKPPAGSRIADWIVLPSGHVRDDEQGKWRWHVRCVCCGRDYLRDASDICTGKSVRCLSCSVRKSKTKHQYLFRGAVRTLAQIANMVGVSRHALYYRVRRRAEPLDEALERIKKA